MTEQDFERELNIVEDDLERFEHGTTKSMQRWMLSELRRLYKPLSPPPALQEEPVVSDLQHSAAQSFFATEDALQEETPAHPDDCICVNCEDCARERCPEHGLHCGGDACCCKDKHVSPPSEPFGTTEPVPVTEPVMTAFLRTNTFWCSNCEVFRPVDDNQCDVVCRICAWIVTTYSPNETPMIDHPAPDDMPAGVRAYVEYHRRLQPTGVNPPHTISPGEAIRWLAKDRTRLVEALAEKEKTNEYNRQLIGKLASKLGQCGLRIEQLDQQLDQSWTETKAIDKWLTDQAHRGEGVVVIGLTEDGNMGVWKPEQHNPNDYCTGAGWTAFEAIKKAMSHD